MEDDALAEERLRRLNEARKHYSSPHSHSTHDSALPPIEIYNPTEIPFGALSNNLIQYITVKRRRYPSVTNFIYSNCVDFGANKEILRNASTKRPTKKINVEAKLDYLMMNYEALNKRAMNPSEIASLKRSLLLSIDAKHLSVYETFIKTLNEEKSVYCLEALTTLFQHYSTSAENWLSTLTNTKDKDIYYVFDSAQSDEEQALYSILGVDSKGIGDNIIGKTLMEVRNNVYKKFLSQQSLERERIQKETVFTKFLAVVVFLEFLKRGELPSANDDSLAKRMTILRESGRYDIDVVYRMYKDGRLTEIDGLEEIPADAMLIPNTVKQLFIKYKNEVRDAYNQARIDIVWRAFLTAIIKDKYPKAEEEVVLNNVRNYPTLVSQSEHLFFEIVDGDKKTVVEKSKLLENMKNIVYVTYLQEDKLPSEIQKKIESKIESSLKEQGHHFNIGDDESGKKEEGVDADESASTSSTSSASSSSSDDVIKQAFRHKPKPLETIREEGVSSADKHNQTSLRSKIESLSSSPSVISGLANKSQLEMERIYRKLLYEELEIPTPYRENIVEMISDIRKLGGDVSQGSLETVRENLSKAIANASENDRALVKEINAKLRVSYSIYELEQKLKIARARKQVEARPDLKDIHQVIRAEKKHGGREALLLPLYEEALHRGTFEDSIKVFHDVSKNTDSLALLSLLHKQTPVFKGDVRISNEGHPIVRGFENGMEYVMCYLMSKIRILGETERRPDVPREIRGDARYEPEEQVYIPYGSQGDIAVYNAEENIYLPYGGYQEGVFLTARRDKPEDYVRPRDLKRETEESDVNWNLRRREIIEMREPPALLQKQLEERARETERRRRSKDDTDWLKPFRASPRSKRRSREQLRKSHELRAKQQRQHAQDITQTARRDRTPPRLEQE